MPEIYSESVVIFNDEYTGIVPPEETDFLLREFSSGFYILQEIGDKIILEENLG